MAASPFVGGSVQRSAVARHTEETAQPCGRARPAVVVAYGLAALRRASGVGRAGKAEALETVLTPDVAVAALRRNEAGAVSVGLLASAAE